jgi:GntR family transcriptional regulator/MocR family aminotransferase
MRNKAFVIEDDFDCEFRYKTKLMPSLQALDRSGNVIYVGTFSSALMPSLRVGYMVLPLTLLDQVKSFVYLTNTVPHIIRRTLAHFMESGYWESNLRKMNKVYRQKYEACVTTLKKLPSDRIAFHNTPSGLNIFIIIFTRLTEAEVVRRASEKNILITPGGQFHYNKRPARRVEVLFEFGSIPTKEIEQVIMKLYASWFNS